MGIFSILRVFLSHAPSSYGEHNVSLGSRRARLLQFEFKHEGQQLLAQRLAIASEEPSEDVPTIMEVEDSSFLLLELQCQVLSTSGP